MYSSNYLSFKRPGISPRIVKKMIDYDSDDSFENLIISINNKYDQPKFNSFNKQTISANTSHKNKYNTNREVGNKFKTSDYSTKKSQSQDDVLKLINDMRNMNMEDCRNIINEKRKEREINSKILQEKSSKNYRRNIDFDYNSYDSLKKSISGKMKKIPEQLYDRTIGPNASLRNESDIFWEGDISYSEREREVQSFTTSNINHSVPNEKSQSKNKNRSKMQQKFNNDCEKIRKEDTRKTIEMKKKEMERNSKLDAEELSNKYLRNISHKENIRKKTYKQIEDENEQYARMMDKNKKSEAERNKQRTHEEVLEKILPIKKNFDDMWNWIGNLHANCNDEDSVTLMLQNYTDRLTSLSKHWDSVNEKITTRNLEEEDLRKLQVMDEIRVELHIELKLNFVEIQAQREALKAAELESRKNEEAQKLKQIQEAERTAEIERANVEQQRLQNVQYSEQQNFNNTEVDSVAQPPPYPNATQEVSTGVTTSAEYQKDDLHMCSDNESIQLYKDSKIFLENYTSLYKDFVNDNTMKSFKFQCQKTLNLTINSITKTTREQLLSKYEKLRLFLAGKENPNILLNPQAEAYSKNLLAVKFLEQGDSCLSSQPKLAFPIAAIIVALWNDHIDFGQILLSHFRTFNPLFTPVLLLPKNDQTDVDYLKSLGRKFNDDGSFEEYNKFLKKLGGIMYLYVAIMVTKQRQGVNKPHPYGIENAWRWLAAISSIEPTSATADIFATMIYVMLEITGNELWKTYPNQFPKLLLILNNVCYQKLKTINAEISAPIERLGKLLSTALDKGSIPPPNGQLPPNFW